ncbi:type VI secretion system Vgr family protein [Paraburkholderia bryophila]|uniref:Type VI secretion system secreted protein VgrG n=1 Tax=Paraburkholderia bryophila TaxID=420952 RepID=A0A7Y9W8S3_9BURK|nr:type VI secretion system Vgr family protein [Paraburkholderia bryophila]NYH16284.1 type VI secretion system secreted protein VgrG [Paraburkholderia bryophila]
MGTRSGAITGGLSQQGRLLKLDTPAGNNVLLPHRVTGRSRIGRDFFFMLDCVSTSGDVELKTLIAQAVTLWMQQTDGSYLPHHGYVHTARRLGADGTLTSYQLTFSSWMHFLKFRRDQRHWQDKSVDEIITDVFNQHPQAQGMYRFALSKPLPTRSYCRQDDSDWNFVHRLLESEGLYGFWQQAADGKSHTLVVTDRLETFDPLSPSTVRFYRADTGNEADALTQWSGTRTLQSVMLSTRTFDYKSPSTPFNPKGTSIPTEANQGALPAQAEVYEYTGGYTYPEQDRGDHLSKIRMEEWESQAKRFHGLGSLRAMDAGRRFTLTDHPEHDLDTAVQREFATIEVEWAVENNLPLSGHEANYPHSLNDQFEQPRTSGGGQTFSVNFADGSTGFYRICIEAQRTTVPYRSPFEHSKPEAKLESAIVAGPKGQEAYTDELNRVKVLFIWDRLNPGDERASCWVRVAQSDTGDGYGGVHMPRAGEELLIGHIGNDIDRPIALHRVYNGAAKPQWHSNALLSGYQSRGFGRTGAYNAFVHDDATHQGGTRIVSYTGKSYSSLAQGYLIQQDGNTRGRYIGSGVLLHADDYVSMRAAKGVSIGSHSNAYDDEQLSVDGARAQLTHAGMLVESLSSASVTAQAESLQIGQDALKGLTTAIQHPESGQTSGGATAGGGTGSANGFAKPEIVIASAADFAAVADGSAHVVAQAEVNVVGSGNVNVAAGKSLIAAVAETISIFVQKAGMKLFAAKGPIKISAHTDDMGLNAGQTMTVTAKRIVLDATDELIIKCGGSYTRWVAAGIEDGTRGPRTIKSASFSRQGPSSIAEHMNSLPQAKFNDPYVLRDRITGDVLKNHPYELVRADGTRLTGMTNEQGHVPEQKSEDVESVMLRALRPGSNAGGGSA